MKRYSHILPVVAVAALGIVLANLEVEALAGSQGKEDSLLARHGLYVVPFLSGLVFPRCCWLSALGFWLAQALVYFARVRDPLVVVGVTFSFVVIGFSAAVGFGLRHIILRENPKQT